MSVSRVWGGVRGVASAPFRVLRFLAGRPFLAWGVWYGALGIHVGCDAYNMPTPYWLIAEYVFHVRIEGEGAAAFYIFLIGAMLVTMLYSCLLLFFVRNASIVVLGVHFVALVGAYFFVPAYIAVLSSLPSILIYGLPSNWY